MSILCEQLQVNLAGKPVIRSLGFQQTQPALVGLLGANGSGKTTLLRTLAGLQKPQQGHVYINGLNANVPQQLAKTMAYLPQQRLVHWALPVYEVVMLGRMPHQRAFYPPGPQDHTIVQAVMQSMDIEGFAQRPFHQLSGGEQARVLLARTLAQQPKVLLADEPSNGLDPEHQVAMMQRFQGIVSQGCIVLISLHDLNLAARYCDRLLLLQDGAIFRDGTPQQVMTEESMQHLFNVRVAINMLDDRLSVAVTG